MGRVRAHCVRKDGVVLSIPPQYTYLAVPDPEEPICKREMGVMSV